VLLSIIFKRDFVSMFSGSGVTAPAINQASRSVQEPAEANLVQFVSFVLDDTQKTWDSLLPQQSGVPYRHAKLVLFRDVTDSSCGLAQSATGPFYCPADEKVYIDLGFYDELTNRFGAPGEFAQAYVLAHEIGHHVQKVLGISGKVHALQQGNPSEANPLSVRLELQADCLAGVWGNSTAQRNLIEQQDVDAGIRAAGAVGDDRLQRMAWGRVSPESFTHGSSAQRVEWFQRGLTSGDMAQCNTFAGR
jgi:predicted metalloprotease